ncbi:uncharacterized protein RB166_020513 [Leptodactylus fuscus]
MERLQKKSKDCTSFTGSGYLSYLKLEGPAQKTRKVPDGTKSTLQQLRRIVLKDIKNEPHVNSGLKRPLGSLKRKMSESGGQSILQCNSRLANEELDKGHGFTGSISEQNVTVCTDLTNTLLSPQDEASVQKVLKNNDSLVSSVVAKDLPPSPPATWFSPPGCSSASKVLGLSNMSLSYFTDPTASNENLENEPAELSLTNSDKYFSTPMPSKGRTKKKLTPVLEVDFEDNMSEEWQPQDKVSRIHMPPVDCTNVSLHESPTKTPLYRSFFAAECQEIVNRIKNVETELKNTPGKRKVEELDVSTIDAEPLPFDCTPMKSMLACEAAKVLRSLESSPVKEGLSLFGESLLDLSNMQLNDFNLSECGIKNNKDNPEGLSLSDGQKGVYIKRQKTESLEKNYREVNPMNETSPLPNVLESLTPEMSAMEPSHTYATNKCAVTPKRVLPTEPKGVTEATVLIHDVTVSGSFNQVNQTSVQPLVSATKSSALGHEGAITCIGQLSDPDDHKLSCVVFAHSLSNCRELPPTDTTQVIEVNQVYTNTPLNITSAEEVNAANASQVIEILPVISNTTHEILYVQEESDLANIVQVTDKVVPSGNTTHDIPSMLDATSANTTAVLDFVPLSTNTTHDITPPREAATTTNTTQIIEEGTQLPANTSRDLPSTHEGKTANITLDLEMAPQSCLNATRDISSVDGAVLTANAAQVIEIAPLVSEITTSDERIVASGAQDGETVEKSSGETIPTSFTDAVTKDSCNAKEICEVMPNNPDHSLRDVTQPCSNRTLDVLAQNGVSIDNLNLPAITGTDPEISTSNSVCDSNAENKMDLTKLNDHEKVSKLDAQENIVVNDVRGSEEKTSSLNVIDPSTLVSPLAQAILNVTEGHTLEECESNGTEMASSEKEVDVCKESGQPLPSESCSMIQEEEENTHDLSVFSVGSLSFVTSTPVNGLNNFQFQKTSRESVPQDPNVSIGSVFDDSANKMIGEQRRITQHGSQEAQGLNCHDKGKPVSRGSFLPSNLQRSMVPPSDVAPRSIPSTSSIPSARRSLALHQNPSQNPARESVSKAVPTGLPARGIIRPPMARQSLSRPSLGFQKQAMEGTVGSNIPNRLTGGKLKSPKAAAVVKARSTTTHAPLPLGASSVKPPSRLGAPGATGRLSVGGHNAVANQHNTPSGETVSFVRPKISAGMRTGLPRPGASSIRPPLPQSQKVSLKLKSHIQGLSTKRNQRELPTLGFRRENGSKAESASVVRSKAKPATLALDSTKDITSCPTDIGASQKHTIESQVENLTEVQSSLPLEETGRIPSMAAGLAESGQESCQHLQTCNCCHVSYNKLLQENEELKRRLGERQLLGAWILPKHAFTLSTLKVIDGLFRKQMIRPLSSVKSSTKACRRYLRCD